MSFRNFSSSISYTFAFEDVYYSVMCIVVQDSCTYFSNQALS